MLWCITLYVLKQRGSVSGQNCQTLINHSVDLIIFKAIIHAYLFKDAMYIKDISFFLCKIIFYFTEWTPKAVFSRVPLATNENTSFGVHEWNKIWSDTEKIKFSVSFMFLIFIFHWKTQKKISNSGQKYLIMIIIIIRHVKWHYFQHAHWFFTKN